MSDQALAAEFSKADFEQWRTLAKRAHSDVSAARTLDDIAVEPLYARAPNAQLIAGTPSQDGWDIVQRIDHPGPSQANRQALDDLENGAGGLSLVVAGGAMARGFGLVLNNAADLDMALDGIDISAIALRLEAGGVSLGLAAHITALAHRRKLDLGALDLDLGLDPISVFAARGVFPADYSAIGARLADVGAALKGLGFAGRMIAADGRMWHAAGASEAQELACVLALAVQYLRDFEAAGLDPDWGMRRIGAVLAADSDQFLTIAKFRALRMLMARACQVMGLEEHTLYIHGETAWRMMTRLDPQTNMLRNACAAFSAAVGGADSICVLPFTCALGLPDPFARRMARNLQLIVKHEAHLDRVVDPAAGSGAIEALTGALAKAAWDLFRDMDRQGGMAEAVRTQRLQGEIAASRKARQTLIQSGERQIVGTTAYAPPEEISIEVLRPEMPAPASGAKAADLPAPGGGVQFDAMVELAAEGISPAALMGKPAAKPAAMKPLSLGRLAEPFEEGAAS